jgi:hypothetical protein
MRIIATTAAIGLFVAVTACDKTSGPASPATATGSGSGSGSKAAAPTSGADDDVTLASAVPVTGGGHDVPATGAAANGAAAKPKETSDPCGVIEHALHANVVSEHECNDYLGGDFTLLPKTYDPHKCMQVRLYADEAVMGTCACGGKVINDQLLVPNAYHCDGDQAVPNGM